MRDIRYIKSKLTRTKTKTTKHERVWRMIRHFNGESSDHKILQIFREPDKNIVQIRSYFSMFNVDCLKYTKGKCTLSNLY